MNFTQEIWPLPNGEPVVVGKFDQDPVLVAVIDDVEVSRLIIELKTSDGQFFSVLYIDGGLHLSGVAELRPMAWTRGTFFICIGRRALFLSQGQVQVVMFLLSMLRMLPGFHLLEGLSHLADAGRGGMDETQPQNQVQ